MKISKMAICLLSTTLTLTNLTSLDIALADDQDKANSTGIIKYSLPYVGNEGIIGENQITDDNSASNENSTENNEEIEDYLTTGTWIDNELKVRAVPETSYGQGSPMCKNVRYSIKSDVKGIQFDVTLPQRPNFSNSWDNHCIYIGYEGLEIGLSTTPFKDGYLGYTWFYNYSFSTIGNGITHANKSGRGEDLYFDYGSTVTMQLYLGIDQRLHLNFISDGQLYKDVWVSPIEHKWSTYKYLSPQGKLQPGTRIINSLEQNDKNVPWNIEHQKVSFKNIKLLKSDGWNVPTTADVKWGSGDLLDRYGKPYSGIEYTVPADTPLTGIEDLGALPSISFGDVLTDNFAVVTK